jgi:hypothetical protein
MKSTPLSEYGGVPGYRAHEAVIGYQRPDAAGGEQFVVRAIHGLVLLQVGRMHPLEVDEHIDAEHDIGMLPQ